MAKRYPMDRLTKLYVTNGIREGKAVSDMMEYVGMWYERSKISDEVFEWAMDQLEAYAATFESVGDETEQNDQPAENESIVF